MKNILVIYFTQTGQAKEVLDATLMPFENKSDYKVYYQFIKPKKAFPYPWSYTQFFDVFPETVHAVPCDIEPITVDKNMNYDLVVIAYQPWFLSVCVPINSFLKSEAAKTLLANKPVVTLINCRNMWLGAQEKMKKQLIDLKAQLVGNIVFADQSSNLISLVTVLAYVLKGKKENFMGVFPKYGVNENHLKTAPEFGTTIQDHLEKNTLNELQTELNKKGAVVVKGNLLLMEGRGRALFPLYANYISKKGTMGSEERRLRVRIFGIVLPTAILILSPVITIFSRLAPVFAKKKFQKEIAYYMQNTLRSA